MDCFASLAMTNHVFLYHYPRGYRIYAKNHIIPFFKDKMICEISPLDIVDFIKHLQNEGYTHKTVEHMFFFLKRIIIEYDKNFKFPEIHKLKDPPPVKVISEDEIKKVLKAAKHFRHLYPIVLAAVTTGIPLGELVAIHWDDIDFEKGKIRLSKNVFSRSRLWRKPPHKIRYVDMPDVLADTLKKFKKASPDNRHNAVFVNKVGNYHSTTNLRARELKNVLKHARIEDVTFKTLQDSYAVMMIQRKAPLTFIQNQLGHKTVLCTADKYKKFLNTNTEFNFEF